MASQVEEGVVQANAGWNWSTWESKPEKWPPDVSLSLQGFPCRKCHRVLKDQTSLSSHELECLKIKKGESFLNYQIEKPYDASDKLVVPSQPLISYLESSGTSQHLVPNQIEMSQQIQEPIAVSKYANALPSQGTIGAIGTVKCESCGKECKGKRGLTLHQKKCPRIRTAVGQPPSQPSSDSLLSLDFVHPCDQTSQPVSDASRSEGDTSDLQDICSEINKAYEEIVTWRKNLFDLPRGHAGKRFVSTMNNLIMSWNN